MRTLLSICLCCLIISINDTMAQDDPISTNLTLENANEHDKFQMYVDTINKYLYLDTDIVDQYFEACQNIIEQKIPLPDSSLFAYVIQEIYYAHVKENPLAAYQIITEHEHLLETEVIPEELKNNFIYIRGFTYMTLGDLDVAQQSFYQLIDNGEKQRDTSQIIKGLFSLGQLLNDEEDFKGAIQCFERLLPFDKSQMRPTTFPLINYELSETYFGSKQMEKALGLIDSSLVFLEEQKMHVLKPDFLLLKGEIALDKKDYELAREIHADADQLAKKNRDPSSIHKIAMFKARILSSEGNHSAALKIYESLIEQQDTSNRVQTLNLYTAAHPVYKKNGDDTKAYYYLSLSDSIQSKLNTEKTWQQGDYLKMKYESEKKENENKILAAQVAQKISQNRFLYTLTALLGLGGLVLFGAFYQKRRFNQKLKAEVRNRTVELESANSQLRNINQELDEFNRILSHDLKEPIRNLTGFSTLVKREGIQDQKIKEYLGFIEQSGKQLYETLDAVSAFQNIAQRELQDQEHIDTSQLVETIILEVKGENPEREINYSSSNLPPIYSNRPAIKTIFKELIDNALTFNQQTVPEINIKYYQQADRHYFEFQDNGIGIAPEFHEQVFGMFKRLNTRSRYEGAGLGLSMARKVAKKLHGELSILRSEENQGSTFQFTCPVTD